VNGVDVGSRTAAAVTRRTTREDFDIDEELADISRYYAKRTLVATNDDEITRAAGDDTAKVITRKSAELSDRATCEPLDACRRGAKVHVFFTPHSSSSVEFGIYGD